MNFRIFVSLIPLWQSIREFPQRVFVSTCYLPSLRIRDIHSVFQEVLERVFGGLRCMHPAMPAKRSRVHRSMFQRIHITCYRIMSLQQVSACVSRVDHIRFHDATGFQSYMLSASAQQSHQDWAEDSVLAEGRRIPNKASPASFEAIHKRKCGNSYNTSPGRGGGDDRDVRQGFPFSHSYLRNIKRGQQNMDVIRMCSVL